VKPRTELSMATPNTRRAHDVYLAYDLLYILFER
jgi:hypothetical protein